MKVTQNFLGIKHPLIQAPMAGAQDADLAIAVIRAGGLGSLPCAMLSVEKIRSEVAKIRAVSDGKFNLNFFCHHPPKIDPAKMEVWKTALMPYYTELGVDINTPSNAPSRQPFDDGLCALVEELQPAVVSFHFGLPRADLVQRLKDKNIIILSSATTLSEALWLEAHGCDAVIAQGIEAGGHRGNFLKSSLEDQLGMKALVSALVAKLKIPVIASGGISNKTGVTEAFALGASAVQIGTAFLYTPEAKISPVHRARLQGKDLETAVTNVFTGRPARGLVNRLMKELGPMSDLAPEFPLAGGLLAPLRAKTEPQGIGDFMPLWAGQGASLCKATTAAELIRALM